MRKKFVYFVLIPALIFLLVVYLFIDTWIESGMEYAGEKLAGAKVEIEHLHVSLNPIAIEFARLQVANPNNGWRNLFETGKTRFALNFGQLLRGKFIIETMEMNRLILGSIRTTDGSIPKSKEEQASSQQWALDSTGKPMQAGGTSASQSSPVFDLEKIKHALNFDSLLNPQNLATLRRIDTLKRQINDAGVQWQAALGDIDKSKPKLAEIESRVKQINVADIKNLQSANDALNNAKSILSSANELKSSFTDRKNRMLDGVNALGGSIKGLDNLAAEDFHHVVGMAHLPDASMKGLAEMVLGKDLLTKAYAYLGYVEMAKSKIRNSSDKPEMETPKRLKGQDIHFPVERSYPKFWIKKILISGGTDQAQDPQYFYAQGQVLNISNDQRLTGYPLTVDLSATKGGVKTLTLGASFDRRTEPGVDNYKATLTGVPVKDMSVGQSDFLPSKITNAVANASITVVVPGNHFDSHAKIALGNLNFVFMREPQTLVEHIVHDVLASVKGFGVDLRIWRTEEKFDVAFSTDLDEQLASRTKKVLGDEVAKLQTDLRNKLDAQIAGKRADLEKLYAEKKGMVTDGLKIYESQLNDKLALVDGKKKEIDNRVDQEKKKQANELGKKAKDALKGILK